MKYHEHDTDGWLIGWHEDAGRANSTPVTPTVPPAHARWNGSAWVEDASRDGLDLIGPRTAKAWEAAKALIEAQFDSYSQISATNLRMDPTCPAWRAERIAEVHAWLTAVWTHYATVKAQVQAGVDASFDPATPGGCPWTIWQIAGGP